MPQSELDALGSALAGQYQLEHEIGRGGMGIVYLARDLKLDREVAVKTLPAPLAADPVIRERFLREARTAARLSHPNIVPVYRADELDGHVFFAMGFVDGKSLADLVLTQHRLDARQVLRVMHDVASALGYAADNGVVHRDVKAENILIAAHTGNAMVTDFGIARLAEAKPLTATGQVLGTVYYMSPEQVSGEQVDGRSDLYSLGIVGFYALTGRFPFDSELASAVLVAQVTKPAPAVLAISPGAPRALAEIIDRCLAKDPAARFQTGEELASALQDAEGEVARDAAHAATLPNAPSVVSDDEAQAIWDRAAELQAQTGLQPRPAAVPRPRDSAADAARTSGYNVSAVRDAGLEAGIPAQYLDHAMAEHGLVAGAGAAVAAPSAVRDVSPKRSWALGFPSGIELEANVSGEMPERDFDLLVDIVRRRMAEVGALSAVGRGLTWSSMGRNRSTHISVQARNGKTVVRATENMSGVRRRVRILGVVGAVYVGFPVAISMTRLLGNGAAPVLVGVAAAAAVIGIAYTGLRLAISKRRSKLRALCDALVEQIKDSVTSATSAVRRGMP